MEKNTFIRKNQATITTTIVFLCGVLFLYSALDKLANYDSFRVQVGKSPILTGYEGFFAWFVPAVENLIAGMMIVPRIRQVGLYAFFRLMLVFNGYIILLLLDDPSVPCGCNALMEQLSLEAHIGMNLGFCAIAALGVRLSPKPDLRFSGEHPLYRDFIIPVKSRIRSLVSRAKRKEVSGSEY